MPQPDAPIFIDNPHAVAFEVNRETRTIKGLALPFGDVGNGWRFAKGTLTWGDTVKVLDGHDWAKAFGLATLTETDEGIEASIKVSRGARGDEQLQLAEDGVYDGLSVGLDVGVGYELGDDGIYTATSGTIRELSTTPFPAFENAKVRSVAASAAPTHKENHMPPTVTDAPVAFTADEGNALAVKVTELGEKFDKLAEIKAPLPDAPAFAVTEPALYRFDGIKSASGRDLSTDLLAGINGDTDAMARVLGFMSESLINPVGISFVDTDDTKAVNPPTYRPDLFKDEEPAQPAIMYDTFYAGGLSDVSPFFYSKLGAYGGLIGDHVQGTPPTAGSFTTETGATITPRAKSGRIFLTREVADQGGNPQVSGLIWAKFQRVFREMLERETAREVHGGLSKYANLAAPTTGADGAAIGKALKLGLVDLAFTPNGGRFRRFLGAKDLYAQLAGAEDDNGRPLFPVLAPQNADGTATNRLGSINVAGINVEPTWSTEIPWPAEDPEDPPASDNASLYVDPGAVKVWNSGLHKIDKVGETAAGWNIDVFAYVATHLYDASGIRKVVYKAA